MTSVPTSEKFLECVQNEFRFLVEEFGFTASVPPSRGGFDRFEVIYHSRHVDVSIAGINWGYGVQVLLTPFQPTAAHPLEQVPLWAIAKLRCPEELQRVHQVSGQLAQLPVYARILHKYSSDVLRGDITVLPSANAVVTGAAAHSGRKTSHLP
jgi:hypothetical protein